ncbi:hydrogenase maturation nickel metallochaperone HypA [Acidiphilium sp.]|uniref:hydrogenase maturation nickel metallochaperone HypA n=1 Tax=Acidiphilium sp. TaxID=527 RepID=UPI003D02EF8A
MHEMALCESVVQALGEQAAAQGFARVTAVWLEIGALASVEVEAMRFGFDVVTRDTVADQARLEIIAVAGEAWCMTCATRVGLQRFGDACPQCGGYQLQVLTGQQIRIKQIEVI